MRTTLALVALACLSGCGASSPDAAQDGSVAISTVAPRQGSATRWVTAYGSATPASNGTSTLSVNQPGQVTALMVAPGATVRAGQPIMTFTVAPTAQAGYEAASTTLAAAIRQRDTTRQLLAEQLATRDQLTQAEKAVTDAQAALAAQKREGAGDPVQTLRAPFDGVVTTIPVALGDRTQPGAALATVARKGALVVTVGIDPAERSHVHSGTAARLVRLSGGGALPGHVLRIDGQLNPATHLVDVDVGFPAGALLSGEAIKVDLAAGDASGWLVPHQSVVNGDAGDQVFQTIGGKARAVAVTVVQPGQDQDVVTGAIDAHHPLIVSGAYQVEDGGAVRAGH
jgi:RND family efflux transporter MFP subunit